MELTYTAKSKKLAKKRRKRNEMKFKVMNAIAIISTISCIACIYGNIKYFDDLEWELIFVFGESIFLVLAVLFFTLREVISGINITSLLDEKTGVTDGTLVRSYCLQVGERVDHDPFIAYISLNDDTVVNVNNSTGKIEIIADTWTENRNANGMLIGEGKDNKDFKSIFYDYYTPSLLEVLKQQGVKANYLD